VKRPTLRAVYRELIALLLCLLGALGLAAQPSPHRFVTAP
jgi:hypothetical protein